MKKCIIQKITNELKRRQTVNPSYSLRAYAKHLNISASVLSRIINRKTPMTIKILKKIAISLDITEEDYAYHENEIIRRKESQAREESYLPDCRQLEPEELRLIQDWYHFAILEVVTLECFHPTEKWISQKLSIPERDAEMALQKLVTLGLLTQNKNNSYDKTSNFISWVNSEETKEAISNHQKQVLKRAIQAIDQINISKRDQSALTISVDSSLLPEIKIKIKKMRRCLANYIIKNSKNKDQVYELSVTFFPWSE